MLITSGASTPEYRLEEVIAWFRNRGVSDISGLGEPEAMQLNVPEGFALPQQLRAAIRRYEAESQTGAVALARGAGLAGHRNVAPAAGFETFNHGVENDALASPIVLRRERGCGSGSSTPRPRASLRMCGCVVAARASSSPYAVCRRMVTMTDKADFRPVADSAALDELMRASHLSPVVLFLDDPYCPISERAHREVSLVPTVVAQVDVSEQHALSREIASRTGVRPNRRSSSCCVMANRRGRAPMAGLTRRPRFRRL